MLNSDIYNFIQKENEVNVRANSKYPHMYRAVINIKRKQNVRIKLKRTSNFRVRHPNYESLVYNFRVRLKYASKVIRLKIRGRDRKKNKLKLSGYSVKL